MARKTIEVETVKAAANKALSDPETLAFQDRHQGEKNAVHYRTGIIAVLEDVLFKSGNYKGFSFTDGAHGHDDNTLRRYF